MTAAAMEVKMRMESMPGVCVNPVVVVDLLPCSLEKP